MNQTTDTAADVSASRPLLAIDFAKLAAEVRDSAATQELAGNLRDTLATALEQLREELPDVDERTLGRVLLTAGVVTDLIASRGPGWGGRAIPSLMLICGQRLWHAADEPLLDVNTLGRAHPAAATRTPEQWCDRYDFTVLDPDGWRGAMAPAWDKPLSLPEFYVRALESTTDGEASGAFDRIIHDIAAAGLPAWMPSPAPQEARADG